VQGQVTYPGYEHRLFDVLIEHIEPERFSWHWHPQPSLHLLFKRADHAGCIRAEGDGGTLLTVVESGFDNVPPSRRLEVVSAEQRRLTNK
jgi:hypothetical protein